MEKLCDRHAKKVYASMGVKTVVEMVKIGAINLSTNKTIQVALVFHMLQHGRPMIEYEAIKGLFSFLQVPNLRRK